MIKNPIYKPAGRAAEYGELACNIYTGCNHRCFYCFAPSVKRMDREKFHSDVRERDGIVEAVIEQLGHGDIKDKLIHLCFTCDPYPAGIITQTTRDVIEAIKESGNHVQILTKGGYRAVCDFDLLDSNDWFGVTITATKHTKHQDEPFAAAWEERLATLKMAKKQGIQTWVSCEPVLDGADIMNLIETGEFIDLFKIGKLNYFPSNIEWGEFGRFAESRLKYHGRNYYIKEDLRREMEKGGDNGKAEKTEDH